MDTIRAFLLSLSGEYLLAALLATSTGLTAWTLYLYVTEALEDRKQAKAARAHFNALINAAAEGKERQRLHAIVSPMERRGRP